MSSTTTLELELTAEQMGEVSRHLSATRDAIIALVAELSIAQWNFTPASDTWSIAEHLEHIALIEGRVHVIIANMGNAPAASSAVNRSEMDELIVNEVPKRTTKVKAPAPVYPAGCWTGVEALQCFLANRAQTMQLLDAPLLRGRVWPHPLFGPWDGYQWLLATAAHTERHIQQIREVKADPDFPTSH